MGFFDSLKKNEVWCEFCFNFKCSLCWFHSVCSWCWYWFFHISIHLRYIWAKKRDDVPKHWFVTKRAPIAVSKLLLFYRPLNISMFLVHSENDLVFYIRLDQMRQLKISFETLSLRVSGAKMLIEFILFLFIFFFFKIKLKWIQARFNSD